MSLRINTNIAAMNAHNNMQKTGNNLSASLEKLSSGLRINKAADDASGMAIADSLRSQALGLGQAIRNANDGISMVQTADGALEESINIVNSIKTKAIQAAQDGQTSESRAAIQADVNRLMEQLDNIAKTTAFNNQKLLSGNFSNKAFQVGAYSQETVNFSIASAESTKIGHVASSTLSYEGAGTASLDIYSSVENKTYSINTVEIAYDNTRENSLGALADNINKLSDELGLSAMAVVNTTTEGNVTEGRTDTNFAINGIAIGEVAVKANDSDGALVKSINGKSNQHGVFASVDYTGRLTLTSQDGRAISVTQGDKTTAVLGGTEDMSTIGEIQITQFGAADIVVSDRVGEFIEVSGPQIAVAGNLTVGGEGMTVTAEDGMYLADGSILYQPSTIATGSVLGEGTYVGSGAELGVNSTLTIGSGGANMADGTTLGANTVMGAGTNVGSGANLTVAAGATLELGADAALTLAGTTTLNSGTVLGADTTLDVGTTFGAGMTMEAGSEISASFANTLLEQGTLTLASGSSLSAGTTINSGSTITAAIDIKAAALSGAQTISGAADSQLAAGSTLTLDSANALLGQSGATAMALGSGSLAAGSELAAGSTIGASGVNITTTALASGESITAAASSTLASGSILTVDTTNTLLGQAGASGLTLGATALLNSGTVLAAGSEIAAGESIKISGMATALTGEQVITAASGSVLASGSTLAISDGTLTMDTASTVAAGTSLASGTTFASGTALTNEYTVDTIGGDVAANSVLASGTTLTGAMTLGSGTVIQGTATVNGNVNLAENSVIGSGSVLAATGTVFNSGTTLVSGMVFSAADKATLSGAGHANFEGTDFIAGTEDGTYVLINDRALVANFDTADQVTVGNNSLAAGTNGVEVGNGSVLHTNSISVGATLSVSGLAVTGGDLTLVGGAATLGTGTLGADSQINGAKVELTGANAVTADQTLSATSVIAEDSTLVLKDNSALTLAGNADYTFGADTILATGTELKAGSDWDVDLTLKDAVAVGDATGFVVGAGSELSANSVVDVAGGGYDVALESTFGKDDTLAVGTLLGEGSTSNVTLELNEAVTDTTGFSLAAGSDVLTGSSIKLADDGAYTISRDHTFVAGDTLAEGTILAAGSDFVGRSLELNAERDLAALNTFVLGQGSNIDGDSTVINANEQNLSGVTVAGSAVVLQSELTLVGSTSVASGSVMGGGSNLLGGEDGLILAAGTSLADGSATITGGTASIADGELVLGGGSVLHSDTVMTEGTILTGGAEMTTGSASLTGNSRLYLHGDTTLAQDSFIAADSELADGSTIGGTLTVGATITVQDVEGEEPGMTVGQGSVLAEDSVIAQGTVMSFDLYDNGDLVAAAGETLASDYTVGSAGLEIESNLILAAGSQIAVDSTLAVVEEGIQRAEFDQSAAEVARLSDVDVTTQEGAQTAIAIADAALKDLNKVRADLGSVQNQLTSTISNISVTRVNISAAESGIRDVDFAEEAANFSKFQVLNQAGSFAMAQANATAQNVLSLLQG